MFLIHCWSTLLKLHGFVSILAHFLLLLFLVLHLNCSKLRTVSLLPHILVILKSFRSTCHDKSSQVVTSRHKSSQVTGPYGPYLSLMRFFWSQQVRSDLCMFLPHACKESKLLCSLPLSTLLNCDSTIPSRSA